MAAQLTLRTHFLLTHCNSLGLQLCTLTISISFYNLLQRTPRVPGTVLVKKKYDFTKHDWPAPTSLPASSWGSEPSCDQLFVSTFTPEEQCLSHSESASLLWKQTSTLEEPSFLGQQASCHLESGYGVQWWEKPLPDPPWSWDPGVLPMREWAVVCHFFKIHLASNLRGISPTLWCKWGSYGCLLSIRPPAPWPWMFMCAHVLCVRMWVEIYLGSESIFWRIPCMWRRVFEKYKDRKQA